MKEQREQMAWRPPEWIRLDHSANIYPATGTRRLAAMFRLSATLNEEVDPDALQRALETTMRRIPSFGYRLRKGLFWNYMERVQETPSIEPDARNPMISIFSDRNRPFLFRVRYHRQTVALEVFHALTDGTGGLTFLLTLVSAYLQEKHGLKIPAGRYVLDVSAKPKQEEMEDSFLRYRGESGALRREENAYHAGGTLIASHLLNVVTGIMPVDAVRREAKKHGCSVTVLLAAVMVLSLQRQQEAEGKRRRPVKIAVPINLRSRFPSRTLRNFSSWMNIGIQASWGHYTLEEIIPLLQVQALLCLDTKQLRAKFTGTMRAAQHPLFRVLPLALKHGILNIGDALLGDAACSQSLSNLGTAEVPEEMRPYVRDVRFLLGRSRGKNGSGSCLSFDGKLYLTFTRRIHEAAFERLFFSSLVEMGIPVEIESNALR